MTGALAFHGGLLAVWLERQIAALPDPEARPDKARRLTAAFTALVERDFRSGKSVNDYAAELGVTPTHLSRVCNAACGRPASALLADRVHYEARRLLAETRTAGQGHRRKALASPRRPISPAPSRTRPARPRPASARTADATENNAKYHQ